MSPKSVFVEKVSLAELVFDGELSAAELAADTADDEKLNDGLLMVGMLIVGRLTVGRLMSFILATSGMLMSSNNELSLPS